MKALGPAISFRTSFCDLLQNEQRRYSEPGCLSIEGIFAQEQSLHDRLAPKVELFFRSAAFVRGGPVRTRSPLSAIRVLTYASASLVCVSSAAYADTVTITSGGGTVYLDGSLAGYTLGSSDSQFITDSVPAPWQSVDVGAVGLAGSANEGPDGDLSISGAGSDIWGTADSFHFVFQPRRHSIA